MTAEVQVAQGLLQAIHLLVVISGYVVLGQVVVHAPAAFKKTGGLREVIQLWHLSNVPTQVAHGLEQMTQLVLIGIYPDGQFNTQV
jgi:hypothetical protein